LAVLSINKGTSTDASRIIQGIVTGVGFLGAGVIVRNSKGHLVHGLTTAACVWVTACIGAACAVAEWQIVVLGAFFVLVILALAGLSRRQSAGGCAKSRSSPRRRRATRRGCRARTCNALAGGLGGQREQLAPEAAARVVEQRLHRGAEGVVLCGPELDDLATLRVDGFARIFLLLPCSLRWKATASVTAACMAC
jgi:hypothetical protein